MIVLFCRTPAKRTPDSRDEHANPTQLNGILTVLRGESKNDANVLTSSEKVGHRPAGQRKAAIEGPIAAQSSRIKIYLPKNFCRFFKPLTAISSRVQYWENDALSAYQHRANFALRFEKSRFLLEGLDEFKNLSSPLGGGISIGGVEIERFTWIDVYKLTYDLSEKTDVYIEALERRAKTAP